MTGVQILYRAILMPLSEDGARIDGILGAANYREVGQNHKIEMRRQWTPRPSRLGLRLSRHLSP